MPCGYGTTFLRPTDAKLMNGTIQRRASPTAMTTCNAEEPGCAKLTMMEVSVLAMAITAAQESTIESSRLV